MDKKTSPYKTLETMGVLSAACLVFGLLLKIQTLLFLALALLLIGLFIKGLARLIARGWLKFAEILGSVNTRIILAAVFYILVTPIAAIYRMLHGDFMGLKRREKGDTYFSSREHTYSGSDLANPW